MKASIRVFCICFVFILFSSMCFSAATTEPTGEIVLDSSDDFGASPVFSCGEEDEYIEDEYELELEWTDLGAYSYYLPDGKPASCSLMTAKKGLSPQELEEERLALIQKIDDYYADPNNPFSSWYCILYASMNETLSGDNAK